MAKSGKTRVTVNQPLIRPFTCITSARLNREVLDSYYLLHAVLTEFEAQLNNFNSAADHLRKAVHLTDVKSEQSLLSNRLRDYEERSLQTSGSSNG